MDVQRSNAERARHFGLSHLSIFTRNTGAELTVALYSRWLPLFLTHDETQQPLIGIQIV